MKTAIIGKRYSILAINHSLITLSLLRTFKHYNDLLPQNICKVWIFKENYFKPQFRGYNYSKMPRDKD